MNIDMAHVRVQGLSVAVFGADAPSHLDSDRDELLVDLICEAQASNLRVNGWAPTTKQL